MADNQPTEAEQAAAEAMAGGSPDAPADPPAEEPAAEAPAEEAPPEEPTGPINTPPTDNTISGEPMDEQEPDPGPIDPEEAQAAAEEEAQSIADAAAENKPEYVPPEPEPIPDPPETKFVVYTSVQGAAYPGQFLTVTVKVGENEFGDPILDSVTLEERVPVEVSPEVADALAELDSPNYAIAVA